ncbi:MAG: hypothetical protein PVG03_18115 [Desulfarculaceae bacterium]|jgi:fumarate hydratase class II
MDEQELQEMLELKQAIVDSLQQIDVDLNSEEFWREVDENFEHEQERAQDYQEKVYPLRVHMENALLEDIAQGLSENQDALEDGIAEVEEACAQLEMVTQLLDAVGSFLDLVASVVPGA